MIIPIQQTIGNDYWLVKTDESGLVIWDKTIGRTGIAEGDTISITA
ncbi:MAG: hypothetical protein H7199_09505 [Burkholderiales bacterium]|nr:hypothetical protein [Flavobacterium sp.]